MLSIIDPHEANSTSTVSRWIVEVPVLAGTETKTFAAHSTRSTSTSKAETLRVPTKEILKRGHCSKAITFGKFYHKEYLIEDKRSQDSAFGKL